MGVAMKEFKTMDWSKYTIDGWLEQYGAYCGTVQMKGGDLPDGLHINQIYWLIRAVDKDLPKGKNYIRCEITDFEAEQVEALLRSVLKKSDYTVKFALVCLIKHKVEGKSLNRVALETSQHKPQAFMMIGHARYFLNGYDKRLKVCEFDNV